METAARILNEILDGVRTPERARSPVDAYITVSSSVDFLINNIDFQCQTAALVISKEAEI